MWRLHQGEPNEWIYLSFATIPVFLFAEGALTIKLRNGDEYKW